MAKEESVVGTAFDGVIEAIAVITSALARRAAVEVAVAADLEYVLQTYRALPQVRPRQVFAQHVISEAVHLLRMKAKRDDEGSGSRLRAKERGRTSPPRPRKRS